MQETVNPLETAPIPRLIARYSIPTALTLMVNSLYNIVDQIFVGQGVGITGMAATNVAFPLVVLVNAIALMLGDGCAANISLCLGRKQQREADDTISHSVTLMIVGGIICALGSFLFAPQIAVLFGSTDTAYAEALSYIRTEDCSDLPERTASNPGFDEQNPGTWLSQHAHTAAHHAGAGHAEQPDAHLWSTERVWQRHRSFGLWHDDEGVSDRPFHVCRRLLRRAADQWV